MTRLLMLVEGQTEEIFVRDTLKPHLAEQGVYIERPILLWTKRHPAGGGFRGGVSTWGQIRRNLMPLTGDGDAWVTTLLDFYGLPEDFPGVRETHEERDPKSRAVAIQQRFADEIAHPRFIPFFALHEFEAWVFCDPDIAAAHFGHAGLASKIRSVVEEAGDPELINHGALTHPKARLRALHKAYQETGDGPTIVNKIGIPAVRGGCAHFAHWLHRLEALR